MKKYLDKFFKFLLNFLIKLMQKIHKKMKKKFFFPIKKCQIVKPLKKLDVL